MGVGNDVKLTSIWLVNDVRMMLEWHSKWHESFKLATTEIGFLIVLYMHNVLIFLTLLYSFNFFDKFHIIRQLSHTTYNK